MLEAMRCIYKIKLVMHILGNLVGVSVFDIKGTNIWTNWIKAASNIYPLPVRMERSNGPHSFLLFVVSSILRVSGLTKSRLHLAIYFQLHRGNFHQNVAGEQDCQKGIHARETRQRAGAFRSRCHLHRKRESHNHVSGFKPSCSRLRW
jgi:hypothetical protein